jgi:hypothetical protein
MLLDLEESFRLWDLLLDLEESLALGTVQTSKDMYRRALELSLDWNINVRCVIDYYYDESQALTHPDSALPLLHDTSAATSLLVDVRPAMDPPMALLHRAVTMPYALATRSTTFQALPLQATVALQANTAALQAQVSESISVWNAIQQRSVSSSSPKSNAAAVKDNA